jgi:hypothetical protein
MNPKLSDDDRRAVDLLLSLGNNENSLSAASAAGISLKSLEAAGKMLSLLQHHPTHDPAPGLAKRTIERLRQNAGAPKGSSSHANLTNPVTPQRPPA